MIEILWLYKVTYYSKQTSYIKNVQFDDFCYIYKLVLTAP